MSTYSTGSGITNETTATRRELIDAIERNRQYLISTYAFDQVDFLLRDIMKHRAGPGECQGQEARDMQRNIAASRQELRDILRKNRGKIMARENEKVEITEAELTAAFSRRARANKWTPDEPKDAAEARKMLADIKAHKDPDLDDGCVVIDASNDLWSYVENEGDSERGWHVFGETHVYPFGDPKRPIERVDVEAVKSRATY